MNDDLMRFPITLAPPVSPGEVTLFWNDGTKRKLTVEEILALSEYHFRLLTLCMSMGGFTEHALVKEAFKP